MDRYSAFLFDLNGTMIDDMKYHVDAWYRVLNDLGATLDYDRVKEECYGKNDELLERIFPARFSQGEKNRISLDKEREYQKAFKPRLQLIDGLHELLANASEKKLKMGIGTAAIMFNVDFVLDGLSIRNFFEAIVSADDVARSKPDPETWIQLAEKLNIVPKQCLVFEDSPKGVESAERAGMDCLVLTTMHEPAEFDHLGNIIRFAPNYLGLSPELFA